MKFYFDGCSNTWGAELAKPELSRYSKLVSDFFCAEEHNIARRGGSDKRVLRNLLETDLSQYDYVIVQLTCKNRTEFWKEEKQIWQQVRKPPRKESKIDRKNWWHYYFSNIYTEKLGDMNQLMYYHAMKNVLKDKKHLIIGISGLGHILRAPVDINFTDHRIAPGGHPNEEGHKQIANEIIKCISI